MVKNPSEEVVRKVQRLYRDNAPARQLFDAIARRVRDASALSVETMERQLSLSRGECVTLAKAIAETGCAEFYVGRRGSKTRLSWLFSCISVGRAAAGEVVDLEEAHEPVAETELEVDNPLPAPTATAQPVLSIPDLKRQLAVSLGVEERNIEVIIRG